MEEGKGKNVIKIQYQKYATTKLAFVSPRLRVPGST